jgi:hypothetical protein
MVIKKLLYFCLPIVFGIPFLLMTDLFPLHRYGMFAGLARKKQPLSQYSIEIHLTGKWTKLEAENEYLDKNYFPLVAERAFGHLESEASLASKINASQKIKPDSIRIRKISQQKPDSTRFVFPTI